MNKTKLTAILFLVGAALMLVCSIILAVDLGANLGGSKRAILSLVLYLGCGVVSAVGMALGGLFALKSKKFAFEAGAIGLILAIVYLIKYALKGSFGIWTAGYAVMNIGVIIAVLAAAVALVFVEKPAWLSK